MSAREWSIGMSSRTGPGRPVEAMWKASWTYSGICRGSVTWKECLTKGSVEPRMSASWKPSVPIRSVRTWPVMKTVGTESIIAAASAVTRLVAPGAEVATTLVTAIADAMMDSVPTVFITGQVRTELIGTDGFQEADILGATLPFVKHSFQATDPRHIPEYVHEAFHVASTGRPGPVLIDIPMDLSRADIDYEARTEPVEMPGYKPSTDGNIKQIRIAAKALANAKRP